MAGQSLTVKLSRGDNTPWGFRLQGGKDFNAPLAVQRVNPNSLADQAGLQQGDAILTIQNQSTDFMRHKEAQDCIIRAGNYLDMAVLRGGTRIWKPSVVADKPQYIPTHDTTTVTKTSLAANKQDYNPIGVKHNVNPKPFSQDTLPGVMHKQYNSPVNIYSMESIAEAISAHTEVLAGGAKGINFMKQDKPINTGSAVYQLVHQDDVVPKGDSHTFSEPVNTQSNAFRRLQINLDSEDGPVNAPPMRNAVYPTTPPVTKHVESPILKPSSDKGGANQSLCAECGRLIVGVFVRIKDRSMHAECFRCSTCGTSLKNAGYFNVNDKLYCDIHAKQASRMIGGTPHLEPLTISAGSPIPSSASIVGSGPNFPSQLSSYSPQGGSHSPSTLMSNISPVPFHTSKPMSPVNPHVPSYGGGPTIYTHPITAPMGDSHRPLPGGAKFVWPPPKASPTTPEPTFESNATPSIPTYRPPPGTQHITSPPVKSPISPPIGLMQTVPAKIPPPPAPKPHPPAQTSTVTSSPAWSSQTPTTPSAGFTPTTGSRPAPRRGRGQLKPQSGPGTRIPICSVCGSPIRGPFIVALGKTWCPEHFLCKNTHCRRQLQDIGFVEEQGQLYCENCWESYLAPNCSKCSGRIKGDCLNALDKQWHPECFVCVYCHKAFGNSSFYLEDGQPYCEKDWNELFTTRCVGCGFPIEAGDRWVEALNNNYHSQCFKCTICQKNLEGQSFYAKGGRPFCKAHAR